MTVSSTRHPDESRGPALRNRDMIVTFGDAQVTLSLPDLFDIRPVAPRASYAPVIPALAT
jgi:hypothetical protein